MPSKEMKHLVIEEQDYEVVDAQARSSVSGLAADVAALSADDIAYDNTSTHLTSNNVQDVVDEMAEQLNDEGFVMGTSGNFHYRKWNYGLLEIWGFRRYRATCTFNQNGNIWDFKFPSLGTYPIPFVELYSVVGNATLDGITMISSITFADDSLTDAPPIGAIRGKATTIGGADLNLYACGLWKSLS